MFTPRCLPLLIGSLPISNHEEAVNIILSHTPEIPLWPQLPKLPREGMVRQFLSGFPGLADADSRCFVNTSSDNFENEMTSFYEEYIQVIDSPSLLKNSRFGLGPDTALGFSTFTDVLDQRNLNFETLKGQITGPITIGIGVADQNSRSIFYDDNLRDMLIKLLALKGRWQVEQLNRYTGSTQPIIFIDEPGMVSFGSSAFQGISKEMVQIAMVEVIEGIQQGGGLAGVHICANGDWEPVLSSSADIISFDAFSYFENFILYKEQLTKYLRRGGMLAWGIVPTGDPQNIEEANCDQLFEQWQSQLETLASFGFTKKQLMQQTFIAPSCGTGSLRPELAMKVLALTADVSVKAQNMLNNL